MRQFFQRKVLLQIARIMTILIVASTAASAQNWHVGDKVQGYDVDWYDATIVEVGTGDHAGQYLVKYDRFQGQKWLSAASIRTRPGMSPPSGSTAVVPPGRYTCYGYPASAGVFRWYLDLGSTTYQQRTPDLPAGHYGYDAAHSAIMFVDGPYANNGWFGRLQRTGGRDSIVLRAIVSEQKGPRINEYANIYCSN
jgi:hypothetical protein